MTPCCGSICTWKTLTNPFPFFSDAGFARAIIAAPPKFRSPGLHPKPWRDLFYGGESIIYIRTLPILVYMPLQTFLIFAVCTFIELVGQVCAFCADPSLSVELQSSWIRTHPEFSVLPVTGSWAPSHTLRAGHSGYSASYLAMKSSTLIIVVGGFMGVT